MKLATCKPHSSPHGLLEVRSGASGPAAGLTHAHA